MKNKQCNKELLFILYSSNDNKGARVVFNFDNTTNIIYPHDLLDPSLPTIGLTPEDIKSCANFFKNLP